MATVEWFDPEAQCTRRVRFANGQQPEEVTEALARAHRYELLKAQGIKHESAVAQLDAEAEARREARHAQE